MRCLMEINYVWLLEIVGMGSMSIAYSTVYRWQKRHTWRCIRRMFNFNTAAKCLMCNVSRCICMPVQNATHTIMLASWKKSFHILYPNLCFNTQLMMWWQPKSKPQTILWLCIKSTKIFVFLNHRKLSVNIYLAITIVPFKNK